MRAVDRGLRRAHKRSVTEFMEPLGRGKNARPPNPPPGPLGIRSGDLRRTVRVIPARYVGKEIRGGLQAGDGRVRYAGVHEGVDARGNPRPFVKTRATVIKPRNAGALRFRNRQGEMVFARQVRHPGSTIRPRPYMMPALLKEQPIIVQELNADLTALALKVVG